MRTLPLGGSDPTEQLPAATRAQVVLGRYRMERRLGAGGFGVVWLAWDEKLEREVAVKVIPRERGEGERVEREARAAARLNHPGIVGIYELASDDHDVYLVSELVRGRTLAELTKAGAISDRDVARIGSALFDAVDPAPARGARPRPPARSDPPRREARQRDGPGRAGRRGGLRQAGRLRRGARGDGRRAHPPGRHRGDARLHGAGAGRGRPRDAGLRRVLARADPVRGVDGHEPRPS